MITLIFFVVTFLVLGVLGWLFYLLHERVEKLASKIIMIVQWCDTLRENEETIMNDFKRLRHEFQIFQKDTDKRG